MSGFIKAISLWQPWASLWLSPNKRHETRRWSTPHRGMLLIHAAKKFVKDVDSDLEDILSSEFGGHWGMELPTGALLGAVELTDCIRTEDLYDGRGVESIFSPMSDEEETDRACGDFSPRRFGWRRGTYYVFREPVPFKGHRRLFNVPRNLVDGALGSAREFI